jgi:hypothetical protein
MSAHLFDTRGDPRYMQAWTSRWGGTDEGWDWKASRERLRRDAALQGPLNGIGPCTRLVLAILRGDGVAAVNVAQAIDDELGLVGVVLLGEPKPGGDR